MHYTSIQKKQPAITYWLLSIVLLIAVITTVGGATRLNHSGLSITEWKPILGVLPPLNNAEWQEVFLKYKETPEYSIKNSNMTFSEFQYIYFWEYWHRLLARLVGFLFLFPYIYFILKRKLTGMYSVKVLFLFILGGLQGVLGWYMVKSGLVQDPNVSHYRLAMHLSLAFFTASYSFGLALKLSNNLNDIGLPLMASYNLTKWRPFFIFLFCMLVLQVVYGAFTAGLKAGKIFNTWPLMAGSFFPSFLWKSRDFLTIAFKSPDSIQYIHRTLGLVVTALMFIPNFFVLVKDKNFYSRQDKIIVSIGCILLLLQLSLGILTLIFTVPIIIALAHQLLAFIIILYLIYCITITKGNNLLKI